MLKRNISPKSPNRAFQQYICRTEMLWTFRIRIGNILPSTTQWHFPMWKWRTITPETSPSLCTMWTSSNTAMHRATARTTPNRSSDCWGTVAHVRRKVPVGYNGTPNAPPKVPLPVEWSPNPTTCRQIVHEKIWRERRGLIITIVVAAATTIVMWKCHHTSWFWGGCGWNVG